MDLVPLDQHLENLNSALMSLGGDIRPLLRFIRGYYFLGADNEQIAVGSIFAANVTDLSWGWLHWEDRKVTDRRLVAMVSGRQPAPRDELGHLDPDRWDQDDRGQPVDPWRRTFELPLREMTGAMREVVFTGGSRGVEGALRALLKVYCENANRGPFSVPVIRLDVGKYTHRTFGVVKVPELPVARWADPATGETAPSPAGRTAANGKTKTRSKRPLADDLLDDAIPF